MKYEIIDVDNGLMADFIERLFAGMSISEEKLSDINRELPDGMELVWCDQQDDWTVYYR